MKKRDVFYSEFLPTDRSQKANEVRVHFPKSIHARTPFLVFGYGLGPTFSQDDTGLRLFVSMLCEKYGIAVVTFDYRGMAGQGRFLKTTLNSRLMDMKSVVQLIQERYHHQPLWLAGHSAGGTLAARLVGNPDIAKILTGVVLSIPAAYTPEAWGQCFGEDFGRAISKPNSWEKALEFDTFARFQGAKDLIVCPGDDVTISAITNRYRDGLHSRAEYHQIETPPHEHAVLKHPEKTMEMAQIYGECILTSTSASKVSVNVTQ